MYPQPAWAFGLPPISARLPRGLAGGYASIVAHLARRVTSASCMYPLGSPPWMAGSSVCAAVGRRPGVLSQVAGHVPRRLLLWPLCCSRWHGPLTCGGAGSLWAWSPGPVVLVQGLCGRLGGRPGRRAVGEARGSPIVWGGDAVIPHVAHVEEAPPFRWSGDARVCRRVGGAGSSVAIFLQLVWSPTPPSHPVPAVCPFAA